MPNGIKFFGEGLPYLKTKDCKGKLIAIEGTDGVGRSTQIELLVQWLKVHGHGVVVTGWTRSKLMSKAIELAKTGNMLDRMTFDLLYATDFADRLENVIVPALQSGFIVLSDRYVYTAWARDLVRSNDLKWIKDVYGFAPIPDLVCYLRIDVDNLIPRVIESGGMDYWESGMDLHLADNIYDSFTKYQKRMIDAYDQIAEGTGFEVLDARRSVQEIQEVLRAKIEKIIGSPSGNVVPFPSAGSKTLKPEASSGSALKEGKDPIKTLEANLVIPGALGSSVEEEIPIPPPEDSPEGPPAVDTALPFSSARTPNLHIVAGPESKNS